MNAADFIASGILEAYALGTATPEEAALSERMRAQHTEVETEYQSIAAAIERSAERYSRPVPASVWEGIARVFEEEVEDAGFGAKTRSIDSARPQGNTRQDGFWQWAAMGLAAMLLLSVGGNYFLYKKKEMLANQLAATERSLETVAHTTSNITHDKDQLMAERAHLEGLLTQALAPSEGLIKMGAMPAAPKSRVLLSYDRGSRQVALRAAGMPAMGKDKVVQLWALVQGKPVSLGLAQGIAKGRMVTADLPDDMGEPEAFALSLETGQAHESPKGPLLAMGKAY